MSLPPNILEVCQELSSVQANGKPIFERLVAEFGKEPEPEARRRLGWLALFAARRALPCWELYCDGQQPILTVETVRNWLLTGEPPKIVENSRSLFSFLPWLKKESPQHDGWGIHTSPAEPKYRGRRIRDCRACDTSCAANSAAATAKFASTGDPSQVVEALVGADDAFDQSPLGSADNFRRWLVEIAIPAAWRCQDMSSADQQALRQYNEAEIRTAREKESA